MEIDEIRKLIDLMEEKHLTELELKDRAGEIRLVRAGQALQVGVQQISELSGSQAPRASEDTAQVKEPNTGEIDPEMTITSPMVGTFYSAPNPDAPPFITKGGLVERGDVVCIVEAMKMMNEIEADLRGRVQRVLVENGQPVEYGQALFLLEPA